MLTRSPPGLRPLPHLLVKGRYLAPQLHLGRPPVPTLGLQFGLEPLEGAFGLDRLRVGLGVEVEEAIYVDSGLLDRVPQLLEPGQVRFCTWVLEADVADRRIGDAEPSSAYQYISIEYKMKNITTYLILPQRQRAGRRGGRRGGRGKRPRGGRRCQRRRRGGPTCQLRPMPAQRPTPMPASGRPGEAEQEGAERERGTGMMRPRTTGMGSGMAARDGELEAACK